MSYINALGLVLLVEIIALLFQKWFGLDADMMIACEALFLVLLQWRRND